MPVEDGQEYGSYDPAKVREDRDAEPDAEQRSGLVDAQGQSLPSFDQRYVQDFEGLLYLGALTKSFDWLGHAFVIRTLTQDEVLTVPLLIKPWAGTIGEQKAYVSAIVALCVVSVDSKELPMPVGDGQGEFAWAHQRFAYAKANWFQYTIDMVYSEYLALEAKAQAVIEAMEKASGPAESMDGSNATSAGPTDKAF
jgi:hypothetical protein